MTSIIHVTEQKDSTNVAVKRRAAIRFAALFLSAAISSTGGFIASRQISGMLISLTGVLIMCVSLFAISVIGAMLLAPVFLLEVLNTPQRWPTAREVAAVLYIALMASVGAFICKTRVEAASGRMRPDSRCTCCSASAHYSRWPRSE